VSSKSSQNWAELFGLGCETKLLSQGVVPYWMRSSSLPVECSTHYGVLKSRYFENHNAVPGLSVMVACQANSSLIRNLGRASRKKRFPQYLRKIPRRCSSGLHSFGSLSSKRSALLFLVYRRLFICASLPRIQSWARGLHQGMKDALLPSMHNPPAPCIRPRHSNDISLRLILPSIP